MKKNGLDPLLCDDPEVLILGSLPGDRSLELQQYYGHPQNRFWKVIKDSEAIVKALEGRRIEIVPLPSTSPTNARWTLEKLIDEWKNIWKK